jgi:hypothetical protein
MIDVITIHPRSIDYPLWRKQLEYFNAYFKKIIVTFTGKNFYGDYSSFVREAIELHNIYFVEGRDTNGEEDWRNVAVNQALEVSNSDWILFLEQDFFWKNNSFWEKILEAQKVYSVISFWEANRLHPAFLLVKRELLDKTRKDFGIIPDKLDHFGKFSQDIVAQIGNEGIGELEKLGLEFKKDWYHLQGLTHNYNLCRDGNLATIFKRDEFLTYNYKAKRYYKQNFQFFSFMNEIENMLGEYQPIDWLLKFWEY